MVVVTLVKIKEKVSIYNKFIKFSSTIFETYLE